MANKNLKSAAEISQEELEKLTNTLPDLAKSLISAGDTFLSFNKSLSETAKITESLKINFAQL